VLFTRLKDVATNQTQGSRRIAPGRIRLKGNRPPLVTTHPDLRQLDLAPEPNMRWQDHPILRQAIGTQAARLVHSDPACAIYPITEGQREAPLVPVLQLACCAVAEPDDATGLLALLNLNPAFSQLDSQVIPTHDQI
jgi:hypothetical protein